MKIGNGVFLLILTTVTIQTGWSKETTTPVIREVWTCTGDGGKNNISSLNAIVDDVQKSSSGSLVDGSMSSDPVEFTSQKGTAMTRLKGRISGHDSRDYSIQLVPSQTDDLLPDSQATNTTGQAVVIYNGFIDCVGDLGGVEVLSCEIKLGR
jgi:hypothetical protein